MDDLLSKWAAYCDGGTAYESSDFIGLLSPKWTDESLREILRLVPLKEKVIAKLRRVYENTDDEPRVYLRPRQENAASRDELRGLDFIDSQRRCLLGHHLDEETRAWLERADIEASLVSLEQLRAVDPNDDIAPYIRQEEGELRTYRPEVGTDRAPSRVMSGVKEALYGLAADYYIAWYVLSPLLDTAGIDYGIYFDFWRKGGD